MARGISARSLLDWAQCARDQGGYYLLNLLSACEGRDDLAGVSNAAAAARKARRMYNEAHQQLLSKLKEAASVEDPRLRLTEIIDRLLRIFKESGKSAWMSVSAPSLGMRQLAELPNLDANIARRVATISEALEELHRSRGEDGHESVVESVKQLAADVSTSLAD